ncbi:MAG: hypothetical protein KDB79_16755 [Acidobacteria bacterium]|nr:hypothetical protein [Acidobacteriota bacterium]
MKFLFIALFCAFGFISVYAQTEKVGFTNESDKAKAVTLTLARKDSDGNIDEDIKVFSPKDIPIYCYVDLKSPAPVEVKLNFIAVKVKGIRPNSKIISISYKLKNGEDNVTFTGKPEKNWFTGTYRVDILIENKLVVSKTFEVEEN